MRVLIVGCGYVGLALGAELARQGHYVVGWRRSLTADAQLRAAGITPERADLTRSETLPEPPAPYDWVVHCVSATGGGVEEYRQVYSHGTANLLAWLAARPPRKLVYTSSTSVYGQNDGSEVTETSPTEPEAETGRILVATERLALDAVREGSLPVVVLRVAGIYGPGRGYWLKQFLAGETRIEGQGERFLNMIHRDDVTGAVLAALCNGRPGEIYNAVDDEPVSQIELFRWLASRFNRELPAVVAASPPTPRKRGATNKRVLNRKLKEELAYLFKYPTFREGFKTEIRGR